MTTIPPLILVVDDDRTTRMLLETAIAEEGYRTAQAQDGEMGLAEFQRLQPDMVLLDAVMPGIDGITCCQQLRTLPGGDRLPILLITVLDDRASVERAFAAGATDYITKPVHWPALSQRVRHLLDARATALQAEQASALLVRQKTWERLIRDGLGQLGRQPQLVKLLERVREFWQIGGLALYDRQHLQVLAAATQPGHEPPPGQLVVRLLAAGSIDGAPVAYGDLSRSGLAAPIQSSLQGSGIRSIAAAVAADRYLLCAFCSRPNEGWQGDTLERLSDLAYLSFLALSSFQPTA